MSGGHSEEGSRRLVKHEDGHGSQVEDDDVPHKPNHGENGAEQNTKTATEIEQVESIVTRAAYKIRPCP